MTVSKNSICPSCGLAGQPSPALDVCASCQSYEHGWTDGDRSLPEAIDGRGGAGAHRRCGEADALERRYLNERRRSQRLAGIARRALVGAHAVAHGGTVDACPHCATDWAQLPACDLVAI